MRKYPNQYSSQVKAVLSAMSIGSPNVVGSQQDRRVLYSADYDMVQELPLTHQAERAFVHHISKLLALPDTHIIDIKIGEVDEWMLLQGVDVDNGKVVNYSRKQELAHLDELVKNGVVTPKEEKQAKKLLRRSLTPSQFLEAKRELRFGLLRWTPKDVLKGYLKLRNGNTISLYDALASSGITKVDVISFVNGKYHEFSNIIIWEGHTRLDEIADSIRLSVIEYMNEGNYWKVLKRIFSLSKLVGDSKTENKALDILNSKLGYLYTIISDLEIMESLRERGLSRKEKQNIKHQLDILTDRLAKVYEDGFKRVKKTSLALIPRLFGILQEETRKVMEASSLLPIPDAYLP
jgi:hypothetical protein